MILKFTNFTPAGPTPSGKTSPPKVKASDGHTYALGKFVDQALVLSAVASGAELECEVNSKQSGGFTNWYLNKASAVSKPSTNGGAEQTATPLAAAPVSASAPSFVGTVAVPAQGVGITLPVEKSAPRALEPWVVDAHKQRLIVRQTAIKAAVELVSSVPSVGSAENVTRVLETAEIFVGWVFEEDGAYELSREVNRDEGAAPHGNSTPVPSSPAQTALAEARQKSVDRRANYLAEDAVCPSCGYKEALGQGTSGWFCSTKRGGCGYPPRGERLDAPISYGEFRQRQGSAIRRPGAPVVSPSNHPSRTRILP